MTGNGEANDKLATKTIMITKLERRRLVEKVNFIINLGNVDELGREKHCNVFEKTSI